MSFPSSERTTDVYPAFPRPGAPDLRASEITPKDVYLDRRTLLAGAAGLLGAGMFGSGAAATPLSAAASALSTDEKRTSLKDVTSYNNYYEFGVGKDDPAQNAGPLRPSPGPVGSTGWSTSLPTTNSRI